MRFMVRHVHKLRLLRLVRERLSELQPQLGRPLAPSLFHRQLHECGLQQSVQEWMEQIVVVTAEGCQMPRGQRATSGLWARADQVARP